MKIVAQHNSLYSYKMRFYCEFKVIGLQKAAPDKNG